MKRYIRSDTSSSNAVIQNISNKLFNYITEELYSQSAYGYYKPVRKQFTVNGKKYIVKNDAHSTLHIISPDGTDLYGYSIPSRISHETTTDMARDILNDAFGDDVDIEHKKIYLHARAGFQYASGEVYLGEYLDRIRKYYSAGDTTGRYAVTTVTQTYAHTDAKVYWFSDSSKALSYAKQFIEKGRGSAPGRDYDYMYHANVLDTQTGEEIYWDDASSRPWHEQS